MPLNNCEVSLTLTWSKNFVLTSKAYRRGVANPRVPPRGGKSRQDGINNPTGVKFETKYQNCMFQWLLYQLKMTTNY